METATSCPPHEELQQLLQGSLSTDRQQACVNHIDSCTCCQAQLEKIATGGTNLSQLVEHVNEAQPPATSAYWPALQALNIEAAQTQTIRRAARPRDVPLDFLQPATDIAYLGRLAQFDVMRVLGRGGMGIVLEAFDTRLQRNVALKVLDPDFSKDATSRQRFCREARAAASVSHENVVAVYQVESSGGDGLPYLVMQLVAGESLEQRLERDRKLPLREIVRIGMQAAHGLAAAHAQGLIHRDIKPGNILLEPPNDRVKLTDFGLARAAEDAKLTQTGLVSGTPLYMAPEQARGEEPDPRSDLFSLGAILYEMCAGRPPFEGSSVLAILKQISEVKQRPLRDLNPQVPEWLAETIDRLLAKKPADRIQTAAHLAELLEFQWALMKTSSEDVPTVCAIEQRKRAVRNRWIAAAIGVGFLSLGLLAGKYLANPGAAPATSAAISALDSKVSPDEPLATLALNAGTVWSVAFNLAGDTVAMAIEDGTIRLWDRKSASFQSTINAHRGVIWSARFSPQGEYLATAGDDGQIKLWKLGESQPVKTFEHHNGIRGLAFSHDGTRLFAGDRAGMLRVWSLEQDEPLATAEQPGAVYGLAISADDETLATASSDKVVRLWNAKTLTQKLPLEGHAAQVYGLAFYPDGRRLASSGWDHTVRIWDTGSGVQLKSWEAHAGDVWSIALSADGKKLVSGGTDSAVRLWNAETGELLATYLGHKNGVHTVAINHDGGLITSGGRDGVVRIWKVKKSPSSP